MKKVLIVEDNVFTVDALKATIPWAQLGYGEVLTAGNGADGLKMIRQHDPFLVICDIKMPGLTGLEMVTEAANPKMQVIFISGYQEFSFAQTALKLGAADYLLKPINDEELIASIRKLEHITPRSSVSTKTLYPGKAISPLVRGVLDYIEANYSEHICLQSLASVFYVHPSYLSSIIKKETGENFLSILTNLRMNKAKDMLANTDESIEEIGRKCGYSEYAYFYQVFRKSVGLCPSDFRNTSKCEMYTSANPQIKRMNP